jgi:hypothetical protein
MVAFQQIESEEAMDGGMPSIRLFGVTDVPSRHSESNSDCVCIGGKQRDVSRQRISSLFLYPCPHRIPTTPTPASPSRSRGTLTPYRGTQRKFNNVCRER